MIEKTKYVFGRSEQSIFSEIYFPKRAAYYGTIFNALRFGYKESTVKRYLRKNVEHLIDEFRSYPALFDPDDYKTTRRRKQPVTVKEALKRINMYKSPFKGWSTYSVDGVFFDQNGKMYEEATQVVRIMFRFESSFREIATKAGCSDVLRCIIFWVTGRRGHLHEHKLWDKPDERQFLTHHEPWPKHKRAFAVRYFAEVVKEINKWIDDLALFVFAYLIHKFSGNVLAEHLYEEEIWVTTLFEQNLNIIRRIELKTSA